MSQSPATVMNSKPPNSHHSMTKKIIAALIVILIGHAAVLWLMSHIKSPELTPVETKPINVRFVKIVEPPPPAPPKPEPKTEQQKPKEVKIVEKAVAPPPKKVEKVQQVKKADTPKEVVKVEPQPVEVKSTITTTTVSPKVVEKPKAVEPVAAAPSRDPAPKTASIGGANGLQWSRKPVPPEYSNRDLQGQTRTIVVAIDVDEKGNITNVRIAQSSGITSLDDKFLRAVRRGKFKPYKEGGIAYPVQNAKQPFELTLNPRG